MELPDNLKALYRHWSRHTLRGTAGASGLPAEVDWFIEERIKIWEQKTSGAQPPYTADPVFSHYRFCNIFRELDRQTIEFHTLLNPLRSDFPLWLLNMFYCRMVARTETVTSVGLLSFDETENKNFYKKLAASPRPRFGTPYVFPISTIQRSATPTRELFLAHHLPSVMKKVAQEVQTWQHEPVYNGVKKVLPIFKFNLRFLWTEVLIDAAYQYPDRIDLFKQFPIGPGSAPTFAKLNPDKDPSLVVQELAAKQVPTTITHEGTPLVLSAENWEGIGCEYRKYTNLTAGRGRRRLYKGV